MNLKAWEDKGPSLDPNLLSLAYTLSYDGKDGLITRDIEVWGLSLPCVFIAQSMSVESWLFHVRGKNGQLIHKAYSPTNVRLAFAN